MHVVYVAVLRCERYDCCQAGSYVCMYKTIMNGGCVLQNLVSSFVAHLKHTVSFSLVCIGQNNIGRYDKEMAHDFCV